MEYIRAGEKNVFDIYNLIQKTIGEVYPKYYPKEIVDFFSNLHNIQAIAEDVKKGNVGILIEENNIVGTGSFVGNHITRVYVLPEFQKRGYGTFIMKTIEEDISKIYSKGYLDASLPAASLYEKLGYKVISHEKHPVKNGVILAYEVMEKELYKVTTKINYEGKKFIPEMNSENGEVDGNTIFTYHQNGNDLWAEYSSGDFSKGRSVLVER